MIKVNEKYTRKLIEQFKSATGTKKIDINSKEFIDEFLEWIGVNQIAGEMYYRFIDYLDTYPVIDDKAVEVGKGSLDSIALGKRLTLITPYIEQQSNNNNTIIPVEFQMYKGTPIIIKSKKGNPFIEEIETQTISRFFTQNPYTPECISGWEHLHNRGSSITVGVYGSIHDKDIDKKIRQLKELKDRLEYGFIEDYITDEDTYYYAIASQNKLKKLTKTR